MLLECLLRPLAQMPSEEEDEVDREAAKREVEEAVDELQKRLDDWHTTGLRLLARGQVALVTLGGEEAGFFGWIAPHHSPSSNLL